jgi:hypothetical protein
MFAWVSGIESAWYLGVVSGYLGNDMGKNGEVQNQGLLIYLGTPDLTSSASPLFYQAPVLLVPGTWQLPCVDLNSVWICANVHLLCLSI